VIAATLLTIAWGALAFGAVYAWAYRPMFAAAAAIGTVGLMARRDRYPGRVAPAVTLALGGVTAGIALQLVPLPRGVIAFVSPATDALLRQHDLAYASGFSTWHSLSIERGATLLALAAFVSLALLTVGLARALSRASVTRLVYGIAVLGTVLALFGVIQKSTGTLKIYGFWSPIHHPYQIYGPFVNHNHFAGWMIMAIALALGAACAGMANAASATRPNWRSRLLWIDSREGHRFTVAALGILAMGVALVLTMSRSGITAFSVMVLIIAALLLRRRAGPPSSRVLALSIVVAMALAVFAWTGVEPVIERFATGESISGRLPGWRGAIRIAGGFPIFGSGLNTYETAMMYYSPRKAGEPYWDVAHQDYLQLAAEGGLLLGLPIALAIVTVAREIRRRLGQDHDDRVYWIRVGAATGMIGIGLQELVDFSLQIPGNAALFAVLCAIAIHPPRPTSRHTPRPSASRKRKNLVSLPLENSGSV
jgi:O-antigen ligase